MAGLRGPDTATPHRMGAALTYARRYALFTLVGIAGEDDLDAPDLIAPKPAMPEPQQPKAMSGHGGTGRANGGWRQSAASSRDSGIPTAAALGAEASVQLRDRLVTELNAIASGDDLALWANRSIAEKNKLTETMPRRSKMRSGPSWRRSAAPGADAPQTPADSKFSGNPSRPDSRQSYGKDRGRKVIDKSALPFPEPRRIRDRDHVRHVAQQTCLICGRQPCDAHHLRFAQSRALGRKVSDEFTVPLCRGHHREVHRHGDEAKWWSKARLIRSRPLARYGAKPIRWRAAATARSAIGRQPDAAMKSKRDRQVGQTFGSMARSRVQYPLH